MKAKALMVTAAMTLLACGGENRGNQSSDDANSAKSYALAETRMANPTASEQYKPLVQQLYVAYFGRPADPSGLTNFAAQMASIGAPTTIQELDGAYVGNPQIRALIDSFGNSPESQALYSDSNYSFVVALYKNILNREVTEADAAGVNFWTKALDDGRLSKARAAFSIMAAALVNETPQGKKDAALIRQRIAIAANFTASLTTTEKQNSYRGGIAASTLRAMVRRITDTSDPSTFQSTVDSTIDELTKLPNATPETGKKYIGLAYEARNGLHITINRIKTYEGTNGYRTYAITLTQTNRTLDTLNEARLKLFLSNGTNLAHYSPSKGVLPGEQNAVIWTYNFVVPKITQPLVLQYDFDVDKDPGPTPGALQWTWPVESLPAPALPGGYVAYAGLVWKYVYTSEHFMLTYPDADAYCKNAVFNNQTGWRLPTFTELRALSASDLMQENANTWTSTPSGIDSHYRVNVWTTNIDTVLDKNKQYVTCVREAI